METSDSGEPLFYPIRICALSATVPDQPNLHFLRFTSIFSIYGSLPADLASPGNDKPARRAVLLREDCPTSITTVTVAGDSAPRESGALGERRPQGRKGGGR